MEVSCVLLCCRRCSRQPVVAAAVAAAAATVVRKVGRKVDTGADSNSTSPRARYISRAIFAAPAAPTRRHDEVIVFILLAIFHFYVAHILAFSQSNRRAASSTRGFIDARLH